MATRKPKRAKLLTHFYDHADQETKDLAYGAQQAACKKYIKRDTTYRDQSIDGWTAEED